MMRRESEAAGEALMAHELDGGAPGVSSKEKKREEKKVRQKRNFYTTRTSSLGGSRGVRGRALVKTRA